MKNYTKYICLFLAIVGMSLGQKAWATVTDTFDDFANCGWGFASGSDDYASGTYTLGKLTLVGDKVKANTTSGYECIQLTKKNGGGSVTLPAFDGTVSKIKLYTHSNCDGTYNTEVGVYVNGTKITTIILNLSTLSAEYTFSPAVAKGAVITLHNESNNAVAQLTKIEVTHEGTAISSGANSITKVNEPADGGTFTCTVGGNEVSSASDGATVQLTATPNSGYVLLGFVVTANAGYCYYGTYYPVSWDVTVNGSNQFTMPDANVTVEALWDETSNYTITYHVPACLTSGSGPAAVTEITPGSSQTLNNGSGFAISGWTFIGWTTESSSYVHGTSTLYAGGSSQTINDNLNLYAVFCKVKNTFEKMAKNTALTEGDYVICTNYTKDAYATIMTNNLDGNKRISTNSDTYIFTEEGLTCTTADYIWHISGSAGQWVLYNASSSKYLSANNGATSSSDRLMRLESSNDDDFEKWIIAQKDASTVPYQIRNKGRVASNLSDYGINVNSGNIGWLNNATGSFYFFKRTATTSADYTINPCNTKTVTYAAGGGTGTPPVDSNSPYLVGTTVTVLANSNLTKTGYDFAGWSGDNGVGSKTAGQTFTMPNANVTLTAQWTAKTISLTLNKNNSDASGSTNGSASVKYDATSLTSISHATRTGYVIEGYYADEECTHKVLTNTGALVNYTGYVVSGKWARETTPTTLYAKWTQTYTLAVANVDNVVISATSPAVAEGGSTSVGAGTTVTLSHGDATAPYSWAGWNVYKTGDPSTTVSVNGSNQFTMPDYDVTVSALLYGDLVAFCEPEVDITLTQTDGDSDPLLITSGYGLGTSSVDASRTLRITVANASNKAIVTLSGTNLKFFKTNGSRTEITSTNLKCETDGTLSTDIIVAYAPTSYTDDNIATPSITVTCDGTSKTFNSLVKARCLPEHFVVAAKINGRWCALPADLATSASPAPTLPAAYPISVDDENAPRVAKVAPKTAIYGFSARNAVTSHTGGIRLDTKTGSSDGHLQAPRSNDVTYLWRTSSNASTGMQEWYLTSKGSSDANFYTYYIGVDPACTLSDGTTPISRYLCIYGDKIMWTSSEDETHRRFRILPIEKEVKPLDEIQVVEWASDKIRFMYLGNPDYKACVEIGGVLKSAAAAVLGTTLKIDEGVYEIAVSDLMTNAYKQLYIVIKNGDTEIGRQAVTIPLMVNTTTTVATAASGFTKTIQCPKMDLIVLSGGKLTADDATAYQFKSVTVYGGGKLIVDPSKGLNASNMYLRAGRVTATPGSTPVTSYNYVYPQVYIGSGATLSTTGNVIYFDYLTNYDQYFGLALPYPVTINATTDIFYPEDIYGAVAKRGSFLLRVFDSKIRAAQGAVNDVWVDVETGNTSTGCTAVQSETQRGLGYTMLGVPLKVSINGATPKVRQKYGIHRMKMDITDAATLATSENSNATYDVTAYSATSITNSGWWLLGNPYMANLGGAGVTGTSITVGSLGTNAQGQYEWQNKSVRYVTVPDDAGGDTYDQRTVESYTFPAFKPFYVQVGTTGTVTFTPTSRSAAAPRRFRNEEMPAEIATSVALSSTEFGDTTHLLIGDAFSDEYEIGDDLIKMPHANVSLFSISGANELFANALNKQSAAAGIPLGYIAPFTGKYVFKHVDHVNNIWIEHMWLKDNELSEITDLLLESYEFDSEAKTDKTRFELIIELKKKPDTAQDIDEVDEIDRVQPVKFIYHEKMYILRGGKIYDATGKLVQINK